MTHFSIHPNHVRVDFFSPNRVGGMKWRYTEEVEWLTWRSTHDSYGVPQEGGKLITEAFEEALREGGQLKRMRGMMAVCLEPYHQHAHPIAMLIPDGPTLTKSDQKGTT
jgi:hypothetical protein